jgi:hypothetical protein
MFVFIMRIVNGLSKSRFQKIQGYLSLTERKKNTKEPLLSAYRYNIYIDQYVIIVISFIYNPIE